jgi:uncharacterized protein
LAENYLLSIFKKYSMSKNSYSENPIVFSNKEVEFLQNNEICRIATSSNNIPHIVPVAYIFDKGMFYFATDYETVKFKNLKENRKIAIVVDVYDSPNNKAVVVQGVAEIIERGEEFKRIYAIFRERFDWVRQEPWVEGESPFIVVKPDHKISWGL